MLLIKGTSKFTRIFCPCRTHKMLSEKHKIPWQAQEGLGWYPCVLVPVGMLQRNIEGNITRLGPGGFESGHFGNRLCWHLFGCYQRMSGGGESGVEGKTPGNSFRVEIPTLSTFCPHRPLLLKRPDPTHLGTPRPFLLVILLDLKMAFFCKASSRGVAVQYVLPPPGSPITKKASHHSAFFFPKGWVSGSPKL